MQTIDSVQRQSILGTPVDAVNLDRALALIALDAAPVAAQQRQVKQSLHRLEAQWDTRGRGLEQLDVGGDSVAH